MVKRLKEKISQLIPCNSYVSYLCHIRTRSYFLLFSFTYPAEGQDEGKQEGDQYNPPVDCQVRQQLAPDAPEIYHFHEVFDPLGQIRLLNRSVVMSTKYTKVKKLEESGGNPNAASY